VSDGARAVLLTGAYGSGKTTVTEEVAGRLEGGGPPFAAIDLDWLAWSNAVGSGHDETTMLAANLAAVVANFRAGGARRFVLAGSITDAATLDAIREAVGMPLTVVRLEVPIEVIEARLRGAATSGRAEDLEAAREQLAARAGAGLEDAVLDGTPPVVEVAAAVLRLAGWDAPAGPSIG
jgi:adenylylsulfate kinase